MHKTRHGSRKLSPEWFRLFRRRLPHDKGMREWRVRDLDVQDFDHFKDLFFEDRTIVVLGGKVGSPNDVYKSPEYLNAFFAPGAPPVVDPSVQFGHMIDQFLGPNVYHFQNIDAAEVLVEDKEQRHKIGEAVAVSRDVLQARAESLVQDPIFQKANTIIINYSYEVPLQDDCPILEYIQYLGARATRSQDAVIAICNALADLPVPRQAGTLHVVPSYSSFFTLPQVALLGSDWDDNYLTPCQEWIYRMDVCCAKVGT